MMRHPGPYLDGGYPSVAAVLASPTQLLTCYPYPAGTFAMPRLELSPTLFL